MATFEPRWTNSSTSDRIISEGRLSTQKYPSSSNTAIAVDFPAPEKPVMTTRSISVCASSSAPSSEGVSSRGSETSVISSDSDTAHKLDARRGRGGPVPPSRRCRCRRLRPCLLGVLVACLTAQAAQGRPIHATASATVGRRPVGQALAPGFVGLSFEYQALHAYTGSDAEWVNPLLVQLLRNLAPGHQRPVLRVGGDSTDTTWRPAPGLSRPGGVTYTITDDWLDTTRALARLLDARLILGVNLAANDPQLAATEAAAFMHAIGRPYIEGLEIGNEPDLYPSHVWYRGRGGQSVRARSSTYNFEDYLRQFRRWSRALVFDPLAGPAFAGPWLDDLGPFTAAAPGLSVVTAHRFPLSACQHDPRAAGFPTVSGLLSNAASGGLARQLARYVARAHARGLPFRVGEMNSVACGGRAGVSNTFASALWALDTMFELARTGVDGVNIHTWPGASYQLFRFHHRRRHWRVIVHPEYYGMLLFAQAFRPGRRSPCGPGTRPVTAEGLGLPGRGGGRGVVGTP